MHLFKELRTLGAKFAVVYLEEARTMRQRVGGKGAGIFYSKRMFVWACSLFHVCHTRGLFRDEIYGKPEYLRTARMSSVSASAKPNHTFHRVDHLPPFPICLEARIASC